jgi:hypothetical protein
LAKTNLLNLAVNPWRKNEVASKNMKKLTVAKSLVGIALAICLIPVQAHAASHAPGPKLPPCGTYKVNKDQIIAGQKFPKGKYQIHAFGIPCSKVLGKKGLFAKFLKLKDNDPLPKPWKYLSEAVGAPKFSSSPRVGFRVQLISSSN